MVIGSPCARHSPRSIYGRYNHPANELSIVVVVSVTRSRPLKSELRDTGRATEAVARPRLANAPGQPEPSVEAIGRTGLVQRLEADDIVGLHWSPPRPLEVRRGTVSPPGAGVRVKRRTPWPCQAVRTASPCRVRTGASCPSPGSRPRLPARWRRGRCRASGRPAWA